MDSILKEQIEMMKELLKLKDEVIAMQKSKIERLEGKNKLIQDITDINVPVGMELWRTSDLGTTIALSNGVPVQVCPSAWEVK